MESKHGDRRLSFWSGSDYAPADPRRGLNESDPDAGLVRTGCFQGWVWKAGRSFQEFERAAPYESRRGERGVVAQSTASTWV
jgi:hypothetical protein